MVSTMSAENKRYEPGRDRILDESPLLRTFINKDLASKSDIWKDSLNYFSEPLETNFDKKYSYSGALDYTLTRLTSKAIRDKIFQKYLEEEPGEPLKNIVKTLVLIGYEFGRETQNPDNIQQNIDIFKEEIYESLLREKLLNPDDLKNNLGHNRTVNLTIDIIKTGSDMYFAPGSPPDDVDLSPNAEKIELPKDIEKSLNDALEKNHR